MLWFQFAVLKRQHGVLCGQQFSPGDYEEPQRKDATGKKRNAFKPTIKPFTMEVLVHQQCGMDPVVGEDLLFSVLGGHVYCYYKYYQLAKMVNCPIRATVTG